MLFVLLRRLYIVTVILVIVCCLISCDGTGDSVQPELYFPVQKERAHYMILDPLQGELLMDSHGCLRIKERLIIWPYGFSTNIDDSVIEIIDSEGKPAMRVGDYVKLAGADNTPGFFAEEKLGHPLPEWCEGPYFLMYKIKTSDIPAEPQPDTSLQEDPHMIIAKGYALRYGVSIDEALLRLELQNSFPELEPQLESNEPATFGGLWIQHEPEYKIVVAFTRDGEKTIARYSDYIPIKTAPFIEVRE
jgi:hypothetical protein